MDGIGDAVDYHRFTLTETRQVDLMLFGSVPGASGDWNLGRDADLYLEDADGSVLARSAAEGRGRETLQHVLAEAQEEEARSRLEAMTEWLRGDGPENGDSGSGSGASAERPGSRSVTARDLLIGSSFALTGEAKTAGMVSLRGRGAVSSFSGREGPLSLTGEVVSAMPGADWRRETWTAGLLLSRSEGEGSYRGDGEGTVSSTLTGLYPYGRHAVNDRVTVWGVAGYGARTLTLTPRKPAPNGEENGAEDAPADGRPIPTDMVLMMAAVGLRGVAVEAPAAGGVELAVKTDAMAVRTSSEKTEGLEAATADATRLRLGLEGTWRGLEAGGGTLAPRLEVGVRHDGGDAETGFGLDLGGGLSWSHPASGTAA